jgi:hypothetical protein
LQEQEPGAAMADIRDLQYLLLHFDVIQVLRSNSDNVQTLISTFPEHKQSLSEAYRYLLQMIDQLTER